LEGRWGDFEGKRLVVNLGQNYLIQNGRFQKYCLVTLTQNCSANYVGAEHHRFQQI